MTAFEKVAAGIIGIGLVTTLLLPGRQTVGVIDAFGRLTRGTLATAMGTGKQV